jgi:exosortase
MLTENTQPVAVPALQPHLFFAASVAVSGVLFFRAINDLVAYSLHHESSSHILLIPFVSAYLLYAERARIFRTTSFSVVRGLVLGLAGIALYWFAAKGYVPLEGNEWLSTAALSIVLIWMGAFLACYGPVAMRAAAFPLLFLLFMVPLPDAVLERIIHLLQEQSTNIASFLFKAVGVPVFREGFVLTVPGQSIEVAKECSGIRSSMALFITCLLAGHLFLRTKWRIALFALISLPVAIIKNGIRIVALTLLSIYVNPSFLTGNLHHDGGFVFFLLALALLAPIFLILEKSERRHELKSPVVQTKLQKELAKN